MYEFTLVKVHLRVEWFVIIFTQFASYFICISLQRQQNDLIFLLKLE